MLALTCPLNMDIRQAFLFVIGKPVLDLSGVPWSEKTLCELATEYDNVLKNSIVEVEDEGFFTNGVYSFEKDKVGNHYTIMSLNDIPDSYSLEDFLSLRKVIKGVFGDYICGEFRIEYKGA